MDELATTIQDATANPKSVSVDGTKVDPQPIEDLIKADQHLDANKGASSTRHRGMRFSKLSPPGTSS